MKLIHTSEFSEKERAQMLPSVLNNIITCFQALIYGASKMGLNISEENEVHTLVVSVLTRPLRNWYRVA